jgi:hypothetical protein
MDQANSNSLMGNSSSLPPQKLPMSQKTEAWRKSSLDYYISFRYTNGSNIRSDRNKKQINYDLFNGKINIKDVQSICDPMATGSGTFADTFMHYDKISAPVKLLIGEETTKPDNSIVISEAPSDINRKQTKLKEKILAILQQSLMSEIDPSTIDPRNPPPTPEEVIKAEKYSPSDLIESKANKILKILKKKLSVKWIMTQGFKDALIAGEEIYWTGILNGEPTLRKCNTMNTTIITDDDCYFVDDAIAVVEDRLLSISSIMDEYGSLLSNADIKKLEEISQGTNGRFGTVGGYDPVFEINNGKTVLAGSTPIGGTNSNNLANYSLRVTRVEWMSLKNVGTLKYTDDETGEVIEKLVDETFKPMFKDFKGYYEDAEIKWFWVNEAWEGIRIGIDIYAGIQPKANQRRRMDNPYYCKLGYDGYLYDATNSKSVSLIDRLKPYQYLYDVISYKLQLVFASDMGKVLLMDLAQIPRSEGIDVERWMYYLKEMKIAFVNSFEEKNKGAHTGKLASSHFNQFQALDLSLTNSVQQYINYLDYIQQQIYAVSGVSPQRMGTIKPDEAVGNVERSTIGSSLITEHMFDTHNEVKRRLYTSLIEVAKIAYKNGLVTQYVNDDMAIELLNLEEFEFENSEFSVFVSNMNKDTLLKNKLDQLAQVAMEQQKADLSTIIDTVLNDSPKDIINILRRSEEAFYKRQEDAAKSQQEHEKRIQEAQQAHEQFVWNHDDEQRQKDRDKDIYINDSSNTTKIDIATISALGFSKEPDVNQNEIPDVLEMNKLALEQQKSQSDMYHKTLVESNKSKQHNDKVSLERDKLRSQENIEKLKIKQTEVQNKSQEKIASEANKLKEKEIAVKKIAAKRKPK